MDKTTKLIQWQRITIAALFLATLLMASAAGYQTRRSEARWKENQQLQLRVSEYEAERRRSRLTPADIEYLRWFKEFDQSCRKMSKQQASSLGLALHSFQEADLERVTAAATDQWRQSLSLFQQKSPPPACQGIADIYSKRLGLMVGQVQVCVKTTMMISSHIYSIDSPQGRKWSKTLRTNWGRDTANMEHLRATTGQLNAALEQLAHTPGTPLPHDLAKLRVSWIGVLLD